MRLLLAFAGVGLVTSLAMPAAGVPALQAVSVAVAAVVEETIFRVDLLAALSSIASFPLSERVRAHGLVIITQVDFAAAHAAAAAATNAHFSIIEAIRLLGCGCMSAVLVSAGGLVPAIALHAFANLLVLHPGWGILLSYPASHDIKLWCAIGLTTAALSQQLRPGILRNEPQALADRLISSAARPAPHPLV